MSHAVLVRAQEPADSTADPVELARAIIGAHSKSFSLAARLLPRAVRDDAVVLYAYCRRVDDAIDSVDEADQAASLQRLRAELDDLYAGRPLRDEIAVAFQALVQRRAIPRLYPEELLAGMEMDVRATRYDSVDQLLGYCYRVASTVGLMMCHVMGVRRPEALAHAAHLGVAMQLTNIARDVQEDWQHGRLYLPADLLAARGVVDLQPTRDPSRLAAVAPSLAGAISDLLARADMYYRSGDAGLVDLSPRCSLGVRAARLVYSAIGDVLRRRGCDPLCGRAVVSTRYKLWLIAKAALATLSDLPRTVRRPPPRGPAVELSSCAALARRGGV